jgi:hypothetical protein
MANNKVAGPDNIPIELYQICWEIMKEDIINLFHDFHTGNLDVSRINYGIITLLPKVEEASKIQQIKPICLLNCLYKWITKTLTIRIESVVQRLINVQHTTFIKGRNIMSGVMILHEILHETIREKEVGIIVKPDFKKAYDKFNWDFLFYCLQKRGFCL